VKNMMTKYGTFALLAAPLLVLALSCNRSNSNANELLVERVANPAAPGSIAPNMTQAPNGQIMLNWLEPNGNGLALRFASRTAQGWSAAQTIVAGKDFGKYAEAPAWVLMLPAGSLIAVWAEELPTTDQWPGNYLYAAVSRDQGRSWSRPVIVHSDRTASAEHSFASLAVLDDTHANIVWLDARDNMAKHTYRLMSAVISSSGTIENEETVDDDVCTCCPTALARTPAGLIAAYRDHTSQEIRDIYAARKEAGHWQSSRPMHKDGWHINACPVNGPALASRGNQVVSAWYTGANDSGTLRVAFSSDGGANFGEPITIDTSTGAHKPTGRPALTLLDSGDALVAWTRHQKDHGELVAARVRKNGSGVINPIVVAAGGSQGLGYPRMQAGDNGAHLSWGGAGESKEINTATITLRCPKSI
jgi:BNR repeat-like domain